MPAAKFDMRVGPRGDDEGFYLWLKTELEGRGFSFAKGEPTSWPELKALSATRLSVEYYFPTAKFIQEERT